MVCGSCRTFLIAPFLRRIYAVTDTVIAVARPGTADETITNGRAMLAPYDYMFICFGADLTSTHGTGKPVPYEQPLAAAES